MPWRDRRVGTADVDPRTLTPNPRNWRTHPDLQRNALAGVLDEIGLVQTVIVNTRTGRLVDGHLRVALALVQRQPTVPVTYVDLSEEEEATILATLDPLSAMAGADTAALDALLREVSVQDAAVQQMLSELAADLGIVPPDFAPVGIDEQGRLDQKKPVTCPECGHAFVP